MWANSWPEAYNHRTRLSSCCRSHSWAGPSLVMISRVQSGHGYKHTLPFLHGAGEEMDGLMMGVARTDGGDVLCLQINYTLWGLHRSTRTSVSFKSINLVQASSFLLVFHFEFYIEIWHIGGKRSYLIISSFQFQENRSELTIRMSKLLLSNFLHLLCLPIRLIAQICFDILEAIHII